MEPTKNELKSIKNIAYFLSSSIVALCLAVVFIYAKMEYRPINVATYTRTINTAYQPSTSRYTSISCSVSITSTLSLAGGQSGTITLQTSPDNIVAYTIVQTATNNNTGSLSLGINTSQAQVTDLVCTIPPGYYYKFVPVGTSTMSILPVQETQQ